MSPATRTLHPQRAIRVTSRAVARSLVAVAVIAAIALALVIPLTILGSDEREAPVQAGPAPAETRYDGGPNEGTRGPVAPPADRRYDGGPEEGTRGPGH